MAFYRHSCFIFCRRRGVFLLSTCCKSFVYSLYFGYKAIPGLYLGELFGPNVIEPGFYSFPIYITSLISVMSVPLTLSMLNSLGFTLGHTISSPLNRRNYKHIFLITFISAGFNSLLVNLYLSRNNLSYANAITDIDQVLSFFIGDIFGTVLVFIFLSLLLKPILKQAQNQ